MEAPKSIRRIAWFLAIWLASVTALGVVAYVIKLAIN